MYRKRRVIPLLMLTTLILMSLSVCAFADALQIPAEVNRIEEEAFAGDLGIDEVVLPDGIEYIGPRAFAYSGLRTINLPASLRSIADDAFEGLTDVAIYADEGTYAFQWVIQSTDYNNVSIADEHLQIAELCVPDSLEYTTWIEHNPEDALLPMTRAGLNAGSVEYWVNSFGPEAYEAAGVTMPADIEEFSQRPGCQAMLEDGKDWTYDREGNLYVEYTRHDDNGKPFTEYNVLKQGQNCFGVISILYPTGTAYDVPYIMSHSSIGARES